MQARPSWITEQSLNAQLFDCCGDEDLFPFRCPHCRRNYVLCYECDTLYADLENLSESQPFDWKYTRCPECNAELSKDFRRSPHYRVSYADWEQANLQHLLIACELSDLLHTLAAHTDRVADYLRRGMRSSARSAMTEYRNLAESIMVHVDEAKEARLNGYQSTDSKALANTMAWYDELPNAPSRYYVLLGITDRLFS